MKDDGTAKAYWLDEVQRLVRRIEQVAQRKITRVELDKAVRLSMERESLLRELLELRYGQNGDGSLMTGEQFQFVTGASFADEPSRYTEIDIGGQDSKVIRLEKDGRVRDFVMNDRCAAGTGRFLEMVATRFDAALSDIGQIAEQAVKPTPISSMCVVFAETEIIGLLASGETPANIVAGVQASIASRVSSMVGRKAVEPMVFTGGVALIRGMAQALESEIGHPVSIANNPQFTGALGAALSACELAGGRAVKLLRRY